jgi:RHS repeat-associated protein
VSATGTIKLSSVFASTDVIVEVESWISAGASSDGTRYVPADSPARVLDTRAGTRAGACPAATVECTSLSGGPRTVQIAGQGSVPAGVSSVLASVTVFGAASVGVLQAYPAGESAPGGLSMVFNGGVPVTQLVALPLNTDGQVELLSPFTAVDVTIDVVGWNVAATGTWAYGYNPDGLRASKTPPAGSGIGATAFTWDRASGLPMLLAQTQAGVGVTYFVYGPGGLPVEQINPDGTTLWLHHDQIGSTRLATDATGAAVATWSYDPYGNQAAHTGTIDVPLGYTGQYTDPETGLQYLRARYYDPATATFLSRDPLNAMTREAYGYVGGNPLNATDPSGMCGFLGDGPCTPGGVKDDAKKRLDDLKEKAKEANDVALRIWNHTWENDWGTAFAGSVNVSYGYFRVVLGASAIIGAPACGPLVALCVGAGIYSVGTGGARMYRGVRQLQKYNSNPTPQPGYCTTHDNLERLLRGVIPAGDSDIFDFLGGMP